MVVVCCSRLAVLINLFFGLESRFFACKIGLDVSHNLRKVSYKRKKQTNKSFRISRKSNWGKLTENTEQNKQTEVNIMH